MLPLLITGAGHYILILHGLSLHTRITKPSAAVRSDEVYVHKSIPFNPFTFNSLQTPTFISNFGNVKNQPMWRLSPTEDKL